ncbi:GNAT family N-acetyltransferase [Modestobacter versicolor]|uniref:N-acetyltransferase n=1 Tax=Modestobacter versicolor TaxID=429133 RepID=A0A323VLF8_9ACTN|nr:GNAT family N-acetyltransferase [Modestobacter versicolor]MBB3678448.1 GNAT superfamily N-acetyltransferase [Modestobacter versicolor]PZA20598.1 N-acetyltransferase [Modestobacter versicolor]
MSTSAAEPSPVVLRAVGYADPVAQELVERVQQEYVVRYGGRDAAVVDPAEFSAPLGLFLVAEVDGVPAGCGGWRAQGDGVAELKRMYVEPAFRRRGIAALLLAELERTAVAAGHRHLLLNSGDRQPEALALYARAGYTPVAGYGVYADAPGAVFLGKDLDGADLDGVDLDSARAAGDEEDAWAS